MSLGKHLGRKVIVTSLRALGIVVALVVNTIRDQLDLKRDAELLLHKPRSTQTSI
jgi:hypothetical protein